MPNPAPIDQRKTPIALNAIHAIGGEVIRFWIMLARGNIHIILAPRIFRNPLFLKIRPAPIAWFRIKGRLFNQG